MAEEDFEANMANLKQTRKSVTRKSTLKRKTKDLKITQANVDHLDDDTDGSDDVEIFRVAEQD